MNKIFRFLFRAKTPTKAKPGEVCKCGKYEPTSTRGVIITSCLNCGGKQPGMKWL